MTIDLFHIKSYQNITIHFMQSDIVLVSGFIFFALTSYITVKLTQTLAGVVCFCLLNCLQSVSHWFFEAEGNNSDEMELQTIC